MKKLICVILIVLLIASLASCVGNSKGGGGEKTQKDPFYQDGYTKDTVSADDAVSDLLGGLYNVLAPFSKKDTVKNVSSLSSEIFVNLNGIKVKLLIDINFSHKNPNDNVISLRLIDEKTGENTVGFYYFVEGETSSIYMNLNQTKIFLNSAYTSESFIFPLDIAFLNTLDLAFSSIFKPLEEIKFEYKRSPTGVNRHYLIKVDLESTLKNLISFASLFGESLSDFDFVFQSLLGVKIDDINKDKTPKTTVEIEFSTASGKDNIFGGGILKSINLDVDVEQSSNLNTVFMGEAYHAEISINKFEVTRALNANIVKKEELDDYVSYNTTSFSISLDLFYQFVTEPYVLLLDFYYNEFSVDDTEIDFRIINKTRGGEKLGFRLSNGVLRINALYNNTLKTAQMNFSFSKFLEGLDNYMSKRESINSTNIIIYLLGAIKVPDTSTIGFNFIMNNFAKAVGIDAGVIVELLNYASNNSAEFILDEQNISISTILSEAFLLKIDLEKNFINSIPN